MNDLSLCKALKALRLFNRYSQQQVADMLGVSKSFVSDLETGRKTATLKQVRKYAEVFDIPVSEILTLSEAYSRREFRTAFSDNILKLIDWVTSDETGVAKTKGILLEMESDKNVDLPLKDVGSGSGSVLNMYAGEK